MLKGPGENTGMAVHCAIILYCLFYSSFAVPEEANQPTLKCNTEKDVHGRLNHRTAG